MFNFVTFLIVILKHSLHELNTSATLSRGKLYASVTGHITWLTSVDDMDHYVLCTYIEMMHNVCIIGNEKSRGPTSSWKPFEHSSCVTHELLRNI